jgi:hypothetical protein
VGRLLPEKIQSDPKLTVLARNDRPLDGAIKFYFLDRARLPINAGDLATV